ncbi:unnamed protein product [Durusdinium trenchii]|uniref:Uncharacterized protein n=1 Tax=Durusdinium trenchii TaxID=1381693 RepID=A0ABP0HB01_9DINO
MGKRPSGGGGGSAKKTQKGSEAAALAVPQATAATFVMNPWLQKPLDAFDGLWREHQDICGILESLFPNEAAESHWAKFLAETFPDEDDVDYIAHYPAQAEMVCLRPYQLSWKRDTGNKGWVMQDSFRNLLQLVLAKGFLTDPRTPGVESPVCSPHHEKLVFKKPYMPQIEPFRLDASSVSWIKGWTRSCCLHVCVKLVVDTGILEPWLAFLGDAKKTFSTIRANYRPLALHDDPMDMNREITMGSTLTRTKPNCFVNLHQVERKAKFHDADVTTQMAKFAEGLSGFQLSPAEEAATKNLNSEQRTKLAKIGTSHGMIKGPFSHASIGCRGLRLGFKPSMENEWWNERMVNNSETQDLIIDRIFNDWRQLPVGLRKTCDENAVFAFQKICRCFQLYLDHLQSKIPAELFVTERKRLMEAFFLGTMDDHLKSEADSQPVLDCARIPDFKAIIDRLHSEVTLQAAKKKAELQKTLENATFLSLIEDVKSDQAKVNDYKDALVSARANWSQAVSAYKRSRRNKGLERTGEFMKSRLDVGQMAAEESIHDIPKHYSVFKTVSAREVAGFGPENTETLVILDFSLMPTMTTAAVMIQSAAAICQQSPMCAALVRYPSKISTQPESVFVSQTRKIEDRLLAGGLSIGSQISAIVDCRDAHGNDKRDAVLTFRLCVADAFAEESPWMNSTVMAQHRIIQDVHMLPPRDLRFIPQQSALNRKDHLNQSERAAQIGPKACKQVLESMICGRAERQPRNRKVIIVDIHPTFGDWTDATWQMHLSHLQGADLPLAVYMARYVSTDVSEFQGMKARTQQALMESWWNTHADAGPEDPVNCMEASVSKPEFSLLCFSTDGKVSMPELILERFEESSEFYGQWKSNVEALQANIDELNKLNTHATDGSCVPHSSSGNVNLTGPDMNGGAVTSWEGQLGLEEVAASSFNFDDAAYKIRATSNAPSILITKDRSIYIHMEKASHGDGPWTFGPGELFGFNTGTLIQDDTEVLKSSPKSIMWHIKSDIATPLAMHKKLTTVSQLVFEAFEKNVPELKVDQHVCMPITVTREAWY